MKIELVIGYSDGNNLENGAHVTIDGDKRMAEEIRKQLVGIQDPKIADGNFVVVD